MARKRGGPLGLHIKKMSYKLDRFDIKTFFWQMTNATVLASKWLNFKIQFWLNVTESKLSHLSSTSGMEIHSLLTVSKHRYV